MVTEGFDFEPSDVERVKAHMRQLGYAFRRYEQDGIEIMEMIRPDGGIAIRAERPIEDECDHN